MSTPAPLTSGSLPRIDKTGLEFSGDSRWTVECLAPWLVRLCDSQVDFNDHALLSRYRIIRQDWPDREAVTVDTDGPSTATTELLRFEYNQAAGHIELGDSDGVPLVRSVRALTIDPRGGFSLSLSLDPGERIHGLGDLTRDRLDMRGVRESVWVHNVKSYAPMPLFWSSRGWGLFIDTTWRTDLDIGCTEEGEIKIHCAGGRANLYWFVGTTPAELINRLTEITGRPCLLPKWAYAHTFVCNQTANAHEMMSDALTLRREGIPCDVIGLEPGWMSEHYDYTTRKKWHPERFYCSDWAPQDTFIAALKRMGFKLSLWLCCDYDLTWEEERQLKARAVENRQRNGQNGHHADDFEKDPHFGHGPMLMDKLTVRDEPWFDHLKKFVDLGVRAFKLDGALQVNDHPDRRWGGFLNDEEMHNAYPVLLNKQMASGYRRHTGLRPMVYSSGGYVGVQQFSATWAGDTGGGHKPLLSMLNHGMVGHANTSCDMQVTTAEGIHFGFLQSWSQVNSWAYWRHPWMLGDTLGSIFKGYAKLRYRLLPYLYSLAHEAHATGYPIMRAMPLVYPSLPDAAALLHQYLLGPFFLVGAFKSQLLLPEGVWFDYWTGQPTEGGRWIDCTWPADRGGALFVKAGAIIPQSRGADYVGQHADETLVVEVFPGAETTFVLIEDDGDTFEYEKGAVARTHFSLTKKTDEDVFQISAREGRYNDMSTRRYYEINIHLPACPSWLGLSTGGAPMQPAPHRWSASRGVVVIDTAEHPSGVAVSWPCG